MEKKIKQKFIINIIKICIIILILTSHFNKIYAYTFSDSELKGKAIIIPTEIDQYTAQVETYHNENGESKEPGRVEGNAQFDVRKLWEEQGSPISQNIAYVTLAGQPRYIVALSSTFGNTGDYIDIILTTGETIPCIMGDSKSAGDDTAFFFNGVHYGHTYNDNECDIVEFIMGTNYGPNYSNAPTDFLGKFDKVEAIANGGCYFLNTDGPVGLDGNYEYLTPGGYASGGSQKNNQKATAQVSNTCKVIKTFWEFALGLLEQEYTGNDNLFINYKVKI